MRIKCPECELKLAADDVNIDTKIAQCTSCANVFSFAKQIIDPPDATTLKAEKSSRYFSKPKSFDIEIKGDQLQLRRVWFSWFVIPIILFCIVWNGALYFWYMLAISSENFLMAFFGLGHVAVGVWLTYKTMAAIFNITTISADSSELVIKHGPIPVKMPLPLESKRINQIFCIEKRRKRRNESDSISYSVNARVGRKQIELISDLGLYSALYIEQEIEMHLGIKNRKVRGGIVRPTK